MKNRRFILWLGSFAIALASLAVIGMAIHAQRSPLAVLLSYRGALSEIDLHHRVWNRNVFVDDLTLRDNRGTFVNFLLHQPADSTRRYPAVVILGGVDIGKETLRYIDDKGEVIVAALAYPYDLNRVTGWWSGIREIGAMREAAFRTVSGALLVADFLSLKNVDTSRVILVGYSFGAPFLPAVMHLDRRYKVAAMLYGGGRLDELIGHNLDTGFKPLNRIAGAVAGSLLAPMEPLRHIKAISPRPLIMIQGAYDEFMPPHLAQELFEHAEEPKEIIWLETGHMMPWKKEIINQVIITLRKWLEQTGHLSPKSIH